MYKSTNVILTTLLLETFMVAHGEEQALRSAFRVTKWLDEIQESGYDKLIPPGALDGRTTDVQVEMYVESVGNFRASSMDYEMDVFFIEHWTDVRLKHNQTSFIIFSDKIQLDRLWTPDIYFANSKTAQYNYIMVPNMNFRIWPNGKVRLGTRVSMKVLCHMDLSAYPIDKQVCKLKILTCATAQDIVNVTWASSDPVSLDKEIEPTDLAVKKTEAETCEAIYYGCKPLTGHALYQFPCHECLRCVSVSYSCLLVKFHLHRSLEYSLLQTYLPTSFIVMISWISFWIDPTSVPGRVGLALTTLLTLSTQAIAIHLQLPPVGYAKAQDFWFGLCMFFLFGSLVEFAIVNMYTRLEQQQTSHANIKRETLSMIPLIRQVTKDGPSDSDFEPNGPNETDLENGPNDTEDLPSPQREEICTNKKQAQRYRNTALCIDKCSRILFPITFTVVSFAYWYYYLSKQ